MINTPDLIETLVAHLAPLRRLRPPLVRAAGWLLFAALILALLAVSRGVRPDLEFRLEQPVFVLSVAAALATGVLAAIAAFLLSLPDRSRGWLLLPAPGLLVWVATIGYGCFTAWVSIGPEGVSLGETARCFATLVLVGAPLSLALLIMLRHAALLAPAPVAITGGLAVAAMTATALSLFHDLDATTLILIWNLGPAAVLAAFGGAFGRRLFSRAAAR